MLTSPKLNSSAPKMPPYRQICESRDADCSTCTDSSDTEILYT